MTPEEVNKLVLSHSNSTWSPAQVRALVELWGKVRSAAIAEVVGKGSMACIGKAHRMGLPPVDRELVRSWMGPKREDIFAEGN